MSRFGLVGYPLGHSFSKKYFTKKFEDLGLEAHVYELFEMESLKEFPALWSKHADLVGVNVTVPYKEQVLGFLHEQDTSALKVGAVNVIKKKEDKLVGYNTDYIAFRESVSKWVGSFSGKALILGSGGSSKAVRAALEDLGVSCEHVSRSNQNGQYTYEEFSKKSEMIMDFELIVNTTPLGMHPNVDGCPEIPYDHLTENHYLFDLVYNPEETTFMKKGRDFGAKVKNGLEMLELQAERSWDIWTE